MINTRKTGRLNLVLEKKESAYVVPNGGFGNDEVFGLMVAMRREARGARGFVMLAITVESGAGGKEIAEGWGRPRHRHIVPGLLTVAAEV